MYFSFDFGWYPIHLDIVRREQGVGGMVGEVFCLTGKIR